MQYFFADLKLSGSTDDQLKEMKKQHPKFFSPDVINTKQVLRLLEKVNQHGGQKSSSEDSSSKAVPESSSSEAAPESKAEPESSSKAAPAAPKAAAPKSKSYDIDSSENFDDSFDDSFDASTSIGIALSPFPARPVRPPACPIVG